MPDQPDPDAEQRRVDDGCAAVMRDWLTSHGYAHPAPAGTVVLADVLALLDHLAEHPPTLGLRRQHSGWDRALAAARREITDLAVLTQRSADGYQLGTALARRAATNEGPTHA